MYSRVRDKVRVCDWILHGSEDGEEVMKIKSNVGFGFYKDGYEKWFVPKFQGKAVQRPKMHFVNLIY